MGRKKKYKKKKQYKSRQPFHFRKHRIKLDKDSWITGLLLLGFVALVLFMTVRSVNTSIQVVRSQFWEEVPCTITRTGQELRTSQSRTSGMSRRRSYWVPEVKYEYRFDGTRHQGNTYRYRPPQYSSLERVREAVAEVKANAATCFVNSSNPEESTLQLNSPFTILYSLFPLAFLGLIGSIFGMFISKKLNLDD